MDDFARLLDDVNGGAGARLRSVGGARESELRQMAASIMGSHIEGHTLQPTALVNEAYMRLARVEIRWDSRAHFFGAAAHAMRQVPIAEARRRSSQKRAGGEVRITLNDLAVQTVAAGIERQYASTPGYNRMVVGTARATAAHHCV
jgi:hypothetical protein